MLSGRWPPKLRSRRRPIDDSPSTRTTPKDRPWSSTTHAKPPRRVRQSPPTFAPRCGLRPEPARRLATRRQGDHVLRRRDKTRAFVRAVLSRPCAGRLAHVLRKAYRALCLSLCPGGPAAAREDSPEVGFLTDSLSRTVKIGPTTIRSGGRPRETWRRRGV
jgi:hypothetical protein